MGEERQQSRVTNSKGHELGARGPGFLPSSATTQGQAKSHALLPFIYLERKLQSHGCFSLYAQNFRYNLMAKRDTKDWLVSPPGFSDLFKNWIFLSREKTRTRVVVTLEGGKLYQYLLLSFILTRKLQANKIQRTNKNKAS